jgi:hypothetical protein
MSNVARPPRLPVVAIFNSSDTALLRLQRAFEAAGFRAVTAHAARFEQDDDLRTFLTEAEAVAIVYDLAPPYRGKVTTFERLHAAAQRDDCRFVIASTERIGANGGDTAVAVVGHRGADAPFDAIVQAVGEALTADGGTV